MQARQAKEFTFTVQEAVDALLQMARAKGETIPIQENAHVNIDPQKNTVKVLVISPQVLSVTQGEA